jgi:cytochrome b6-f complex iron-sulfur subunit
VISRHGGNSACAQASLAIGGSALGLAACSSPTSPTRAPSLPIVNATPLGAGARLTIDGGSPLATVGGAALVQANVNAYLVSRTSANAFVALSAICTYQTCTITGFSNQQYVCPCHGSTFDINGRVVGGPAPVALHVYTTQFLNNVLTIS